jgi:uncharacterized membrane protein YgcG
VVVALALVGTSPLRSQSQPQIPARVGVINDFAHVLDAATVERMTRIAEDVRTKSRGEITIVTLPDIGTRDVQEVSVQIGKLWKVGKIGSPDDPTRNAGAVVLLVPKETSSDGRGHCFIATGRGAERFITDATAGDICREATPAFKQKDYSTGLELVTVRIAQRFANELNFTLDPTPTPAERALSAARNQRLVNRQNIVRRLRIDVLVPGEDLSANPFPYQGKVVGVLTVFSAMRDANSAWFGNQRYLVLGVPSTRFPRPVEVLLAARVIGTQKVTIFGTEGTVPKLQFVDAYPCQQSDCGELNP